MNVSIRANLPRVLIDGNVDITPALMRIGYAVRDNTNVYPPRAPGMRIRWASERQRRYVLSNVPLPSVRRGWLAKQWRVTPVSPRQVVVRNTASYAAFVIGRAQQPFHFDRGWRRVDDEAKKVAGDQAIKRDVIRLIMGELRK